MKMRKKLRQHGSALMLVIVFLGITAVLATSMMSLYKSNNQSNSFGRDLVVMQTISEMVGRFSLSPAALYRSLYYSTYRDGTRASLPALETGDWNPTGTAVNSCLKACMGGVRTDATGIQTNNCYLPVYPSTDATLNGEVCESRDAVNNNALWYSMTLFHPTEYAKPIAGPDPHPSAGPALLPDSRRPARYTLEGVNCSSVSSWVDEALCPIEVYSYFHPVCTDDVWRDAAPPNIVNRSIDLDRSSSTAREIWISQMIPNPFANTKLIPEAKAAYLVCPNYCLPLDQVGTGNTCASGTAIPTGFTACPNNACVAYDSSLSSPTANAVSKCCYGLACTAFQTEAHTSTMFATGTGSYVKNCTMAAAIMVWHKVQWSTDSAWTNNTKFSWRGRWARYRTLENVTNPVGSKQLVSDFQQTRMCNKIFRKNFQPPQWGGTTNPLICDQ